MFSAALELYAVLSLGCTLYGHFGPSGKAKVIAAEFGFNVSGAHKRIKEWAKAASV